MIGVVAGFDDEPVAHPHNEYAGKVDRRPLLVGRHAVGELGDDHLRIAGQVDDDVNWLEVFMPR